MIISAAIPKGGTGKSTMLRTLASVALHRGYSVTLIDGDRRQNMNRWFQMLGALAIVPAPYKLL